MSATELTTPAAPALVMVPTVSDWATGREVAHAAIARSVRQLLEHLPAARAASDGDDIEHVHQARVALRRLRSDLGTFGMMLDPAWSARWRPELRSLAAALGRVRDDDVFVATLTRAGAPASLIAAFGDERRDHRRALVAAVDDDRTTALLDALVAAATDPATAPQADDPATELLEPLLRRRWRQLRRGADAVTGEATDDELHAVRIRAKRCRYAVEAAAPAFGDEARAWAKALAGVTDALGELNDAAVITRRLGAASTLSAGDAFAAGQIAGGLAVRAEAGRERWRHAWRRAVAARRRVWR